MPGISAEGSERKTDRLEAFTDAVLAIAITLPVVELHAPEVPPGGDLYGAFARLAPEYVAYALTVTVIGLFWSYAHFTGKIFEKTDHGFNLLTVVFLGLVAVTPFPTLPLVQHVMDAPNSRLAAEVYTGLLMSIALLWLIRWIYALRMKLLDRHLAPKYLRKLTLRYALLSTTAVVGFALSWVSPWWLAVGVTWAMILSLILPPLTPEFEPGEEPKDELEEADERR